jgi:hypothetical protein
MAQSFSFTVPAGRSAADVLRRVRREAASKGVSFEGDEKKGQFTGMASGTYAVDGQTVAVTVDKKPSFVPWGMIESALRGLFEAP